MEPKAPLIARLTEALAASRRTRRRRGMTLMEIMIVIAIILLLMSVLAFGLGGMFGQAQSDAALLQMQRISERVDIYKIRKRELPKNLEAVFDGEPTPKDPWGNPYKMVSGGGKKGYDLVSLGADGKEGGTGADKDIKLSEQGQ